MVSHSSVFEWKNWEAMQREMAQPFETKHQGKNSHFHPFFFPYTLQFYFGSKITSYIKIMPNNL